MTDGPSSWHSARFGKAVAVTRHALERMGERGISMAELMELLETGEILWKNERHLWVFASLPSRCDNRVCAALAVEDLLVIKTVMTHWEEFVP